MNAFPPPPFPPPAPAAPWPVPAPDAPAGTWRRAAAWALDFALVIAAAVALGAWTWTRIGSLVSSVPSLAQKGAWDLLASRGDVRTASADFGLSLWGTASGYVTQAFALLVAAVFAYHFAALAWKGRTVGMLLLDLRVEPAARDRLGKGQALGRAAAASVADVGLYALACCLLVRGDFVLAVTCWALAVAVFWLNVLPVLFPGRRTLHDRMSGTRVARAGLYRAAAGQAAQGGRIALRGAQRISEHERVRDVTGRGRKALDRARRRPDAPPAVAPPRAFTPFPPNAAPVQRPAPYGQPIPRPEEQ
ncbi:RDD family protein [Actinomadura sp. 21ATH]|uniref:RDD family protein n=1 Tax=Actinomadura sp. 21ATH TaxID=1735444 RepID=UPI0035C1BA8B